MSTLRVLVLLLILSFALIVAVTQPVSLEQILDWGSLLAEKPEAVALLILLQAVLYTFALPGTLVVWLVAPFYPLATAVSILLVGSVLGALGAYQLSSRLTDSWHPRKGEWLFRVLRKRSDIYTQCALRVLPGCPHWAVNYGAGMLKLSLPVFVSAAIIGLGIKWTLYSWVISDMSASARGGDALSINTLLPLLVLAALILIGGKLRQQMILRNLERHGNQPPDSPA